MDYENFKEQFVADVKDRLAEQGADVKVSVNEVNKLKESRPDASSAEMLQLFSSMDEQTKEIMLIQMRALVKGGC